MGVFRDVQGEGKLVWPHAAPFTFFGDPIFLFDKWRLVVE